MTFAPYATDNSSCTGMKPIKVFLTGATGVMGNAGLENLMAVPGQYEVTVLARDSKTNHKKLEKYQKKGLKVIWGDLTDPADVEAGVKDADIVLHVGGMVSPKADWHPEKTISVNIAAMQNIVDAVKKSALNRKDNKETKVVYIGSVSQYGSRAIPEHWGGVSDPLIPAVFDAYAYSKIEAERILADSGIRKWVSLRQTGILHPGLLTNAGDPISFHVPVQGVLEWVSVDDSGRLLERVCRPDVPEDFWCDFYNIGGGEDYRMTNYEFETKLLKALGCPAPEKIFEPSWFATRNFHGMWYQDSDRLEKILHFRSGETVDEYFRKMVSNLPFYFRLTPLAPAFIIKAVMKKVANTPMLGPMWWIKNNITPRINAAFGSLEEQQKIGGWKSLDLSIPAKSAHADMRKKYADSEKSHRNKILNNRVSDEVIKFDDITLTDRYKGDYLKPLTWHCSQGHEFTASLMLVERGGHRCPHCIGASAIYKN